MLTRLLGVAALIFISEESAIAQPSEVKQVKLPAQQETVFPLSVHLCWDHRDQWIVEGRVLSTDGTPIPEADVSLIAEPYTLDSPVIPPMLVGDTVTDRTGNFSLAAPSLPWFQCRFLTLVARATHHAISVKHLDTATKRSSTEFRLARADRVSGVLTDKQGNPVGDARLVVTSLDPTNAGEWTTARFRTGKIKPAAWPQSVMTDSKGRFDLDFVSCSRATNIGFAVDDHRYSPETVKVQVKNGQAELKLECERAMLLRGQVTCQDSGNPMANTWLIVVSLPHDVSDGADMQYQGIESRTDASGSFTARVRPGKFVTVYVYPSTSQPYPAWMEQKPVPTDTAAQLLDIRVPRGVLVQGRVIDETTGLGIEGAGIEYRPNFDSFNPRYPGMGLNPYFDQKLVRRTYWATERHRELSDHAGNFVIAVLPGEGHLLVKGPTPNFVSEFSSHGLLNWGRPAGFPFLYEGYKLINPAPKPDLISVTLTLRQGSHFHGTIVGPDGQIVEKAVLLNPNYSNIVIGGATPLPHPIRNGQWNVSGLDPEKSHRICYFDADNEWGATLVIDRKAKSDGPREIRLSKCGSASVTLVDQHRKPWADYGLRRDNGHPLGWLLIEGLPGPPQDPHFLGRGADSINWSMDELAARQYRELKTDKNGQVILPCLIPGAQYVFYTYALNNEGARSMFEERRAFRVLPGQQLDLGSITVRRSSR